MQISIQEKKENKLLERWDVRFTIEHAGEKTPSREQVKKGVADAVGAKADVTVIDEYVSEFGLGRSRGFAKVYPSVEKARALERAYQQKRNGIFVEPKKREVRAAEGGATPAKAGKAGKAAAPKKVK